MLAHITQLFTKKERQDRTNRTESSSLPSESGGKPGVGADIAQFEAEARKQFVQLARRGLGISVFV